MAISELQIALIGAGAAAVAAVWGYNIWQDRRHRRSAEKIFKGGQGDALAAGEDVQGAAGDERREPSLAVAADDPDELAVAPCVGEPELHDTALEPELPPECADDVADCILRFLAPDPIPAPVVWALQQSWAAELSKPLHWVVRNDADGIWRALDANDVGRYREWAASLQLVDRHGPVSDGELARFFDGVQQIAQHTAATLELPSRGAMVLRAGKLDEFCATVDIQFVLHVVESSGGVFAGTKLRSVAEAAGLALESDGVFRARDGAGGELFTLANLGAERLDADSIKSLATHGLTLSLDVPRVTDGTLTFDRMRATAEQLAAALGGVLVDAQRAPLAAVMIGAIRARTAELQQRMRDGGVVPGSTRALRLFS